MECATQDGLKRFVHDENIKRFTAMLTVETSDDRREMLTRLLAEETVRFLPQAGAEPGFSVSSL